MRNRWGAPGRGARGGRRAVIGFWAAPLVVLLAWAEPAQEARAADPSPLGRRLARALATPGLAGASHTALVVDRASGEPVFASHADRPLVPASNQKVLTATAALARFGPTYRFTTEVLASRLPDASGALPALYLRGGGDPSLTSETLWRLAADLRLAGLTRVEGPVYVDDGLFDDVRWHPTWGDVSARAYHAPVGALMANYGAVQLRVTPAHAGGAARVRLDPELPYLELDAKVTTTSGGAPRVTIRRVVSADRERFVVTGSIPASVEPKTYYRSLARPAHYAGELLRMQLAANGISVAGGVLPGAAPGGSTTLLAFEGRPLSEVARLVLKHSNNVMAESLLKSLAVADGAPPPASFASGAAALERGLEKLGLPIEGLRVADGSGLSRENRTSARTLVAALRRADRSFLFGPELLAGLPLAGRDGTLEKRAAAASGRVRAKTGLLSGVTGLSGFARDAAGRDLVFSVLVNGYARGDRAAMDALDGFAAELAR